MIGTVVLGWSVLSHHFPHKTTDSTGNGRDGSICLKF